MGEDTRVHRSVLHKIAIDLLYFCDAYGVNLLEKKLEEVQLIYAEQMSLYNFIILRKKRNSNKCFSVDLVKLSRTVTLASQNTKHIT